MKAVEYLLYAKIMAPFTGHESKGTWPIEYQEMIYSKAKKLYQSFIDEYNQYLVTLNIETRLNEHIKSLNEVSKKTNAIFARCGSGIISYCLNNQIFYIYDIVLSVGKNGVWMKNYKK